MVVVVMVGGLEPRWGRERKVALRGLSSSKRPAAAGPPPMNAEERRDSLAVAAQRRSVPCLT